MNTKETFQKQFITQLILIGLFSLSGFISECNATKFKVLFIGNSYTYVNDLPSLINQLALSTGDEIMYSSSTPGGSTFQGHFTDATTLTLINQGGWDYVVLQEQSQRPSFSDYQVGWQVYPYAKKLDSLVKISSPCAKTVFYMTWGRKYGDQDLCPYLPTICTYQGMDDLLQLRYTNMADSNNALLCPVAKVWRSLINNYPAIDLYNGDNSHPSLAGSYAAACAFYSVFLKKDPALCTHTSSLSASDATIIKNVSKAVVYDDLEKYYSFYPDVKADYTFSFVANEVLFFNVSENADSYVWDFGDGTSSVLKNPSHEYSTTGSYNVKLISKKCVDDDSKIQTVNIGTTSIENAVNKNRILLYPNPAADVLYIETTGEYEEIVIMNIAGKTIKKFTNNNDSLASLDIQDLNAGIYFVSIRNGTQSICSKFCKK